MAFFSLNSTDPAQESERLESHTWSGALAKALGRLKGSPAATLTVEVSQDGHTELWADDTDHRISFDADPDTSFEMAEDPTASLWDAPTPGSGAQLAREPNHIDRAHAGEGLEAIVQSASEIEACNVAMDMLLTHIPAESGSILLAEGTQLRFVCVRGPKADALVGSSMNVDAGVAGVVAGSGRPLLIRGARNSAQHESAFDKSLDHITHTLLAVPIASDQRVVGVLELLNPFGASTFTGAQQDLAKDVANALGRRFS
jgi:hypothetical protein